MYQIALAVFSLCAAPVCVPEQEMNECCEQEVVYEDALLLDEEGVEGEVVFETEDESNEEVAFVNEEEETL